MAATESECPFPLHNMKLNTKMVASDQNEWMVIEIVNGSETAMILSSRYGFSYEHLPFLVCRYRKGIFFILVVVGHTFGMLSLFKNVGIFIRNP